MSAPRLYGELAEWWPVLSDPADYAEEAARFAGILKTIGPSPAVTVLELGSGGGNNAFHMKQQFRMTLSDHSPRMLAVSRRLNPDCEHLAGDMRTLRLGLSFDAVFVHDAVMYLTTETDLRAAVRTAREHLKPGGIVLLAPDCVRETFAPSTKTGGHDAPDRSLRYLEWNYDPDPRDTTFVADFAIFLRAGKEETKLVHDRHQLGLFPRATWLALIAEAGLHARCIDGDDADPRDLFVGLRPVV
jgi:SAM-dependent methyltransferase